MARTALLGLGHYVPSKVVTNDDLAKMFDTSDEWIQQRTGIKERRYIEKSGIGASDLAVPAAKMACENAGIEVSEIDAIIFATLSPDFNFPGSGCFLGDKLDLGGVAGARRAQPVQRLSLWHADRRRVDSVRHVQARAAGRRRGSLDRPRFQ